MKNLRSNLLVMAVALITASLSLTSCSDADVSSDAEALLKTVPAGVSEVIVVNVTDLIDHNGGKADGTRIKDGEDIKKALAKQYPRLDVTSLFDGASGIKFSAAVNFTDNAGEYLTFLVEDGEKFRTYLTSKAGTEWTKSGNLYHTHSMAQQGNQVWYSNNLDTEKVTEYIQQTEARSFMSNDYAKTLVKCEHDAMFYISINGALERSSKSFSERTTMRMAASMLFDDPNAIVGYMDYKDKDIRVIADLVNSKGEIAKCNLKLGKVDIKQIANLGGNANCLVAISLPHDLIEQVLQSGESFGGALPSLYKNIISPIDGTVVFATSTQLDRPSSETAFSASVATRGNQATLMEALYGLGLKPTSEGNLLTIKSGNYGGGAFKVADVSKDLDGTSMGMVMHYNDNNLVITVSKHDGGLRINADIRTPNSLIDAFPFLLGQK